MVKLFRRFQQPLLIALTIFTIISFVVLYNLPGTRSGGFRNDTVGQIYGHSVAQTEVNRATKRFNLWFDDLRTPELRPLIGNANSKNEAESNFAWNSIVLRHEAEALGIMSADPGDAERQTIDALVEPRLRKMFEVNGIFDAARYQMFVQNALSPRGFTARELEEVIADQIRIEKVKEVVGSTVAATPAEVREYYTESHGKLEASVVRLKLEDFKAAVQVTDEDVKKLFEERKATLKTPEKRKVKFAAFTLPKPEKPTDKPLAGKERVEAMRKLADKAQELAQTMTAKGADFAAETAKAGATVAETPAFEAGMAPPELGFSPKAAMAAFRLTKAEPNSDAVDGPNGYYVLQLSAVDESRPQTLDEAKAQLTEQLKQERSQEAMGLKATEVRNKIEAEMKAGKSFADAATAAGAKAEKLPAFSMTDRLKDDPDAQPIMGRAAELTEGQLSEFTPTQAGGVLIRLDKRVPIDDAEFAKEKDKLAKELEDAKREAVFHDWLRARVKAANLQLYRG